MKTILLTQKSICGILGLMMATTIVWKANLKMQEINSERITEKIEKTKPTISILPVQSFTYMHFEEISGEDDISV
ncbi:hypothetical protein [Algoriphagus sediminis]|uniref:Uncharacterized protein n=1 Tax=Algoriphagus sediminis TaxID=3057113 RepID=A0ABT7YCD7_9BACT|nr:hypothetical protein [Algoriphagus sediminis]MDN3204189.1 hypothetical protein [Algoriphagus sediminis]